LTMHLIDPRVIIAVPLYWSAWVIGVQKETFQSGTHYREINLITHWT